MHIRSVVDSSPTSREHNLVHHMISSSAVAGKYTLLRLYWRGHRREAAGRRALLDRGRAINELTTTPNQWGDQKISPGRSANNSSNNEINAKLREMVQSLQNAIASGMFKLDLIF